MILERLAFAPLGCIVAVLVTATVIEKMYGTGFVVENIYHSSGFILMWAVFAGVSLAYIIRQKLFRQKAVFLIHLSFLLILTGAFTTYLQGKQGILPLRINETATSFIAKDNEQAQPLPFGITLDDFRIVYYPGTPSPMDYVSIIHVSDKEGRKIEGEVAMNQIFKYKGYRFYQSDYDEDGLGTILSVSYDPLGIGITYTGYALLLLSILLFFFADNTRYKLLLKSRRKGIATICLLLLCSASIYAAPANERPKALPPETASAFGDLYILHNNRICPLQTLAREFTTKLYGSPTYQGLSAEQVFTGWMFFYTSWKSQPMIKIKNKEVRNILGIEGKYAALDDFTDRFNEYKLDSMMSKSRHGETSSLKRSIEEADEKYNIIRFFYSGKMLKIFPLQSNDDTRHISWFSQGDNLPGDMDDAKWLFVKKTQDYIHEMVIKKDYEGVVATLQKIKEYQYKEAAPVLPSNTRFRAEKLYNILSYSRVLAILCLMAGLLSFFYYCICMTGEQHVKPVVSKLLTALFIIVFVYLTIQISLRWITSGHLPLSNGFETMQFMAWCSLLAGFLMRKKGLFLPFGFLLCGLTLMVSLMGESNPQITQLMPVLSSPLLSIHVVVIMLAYSLFAFMMLNGVSAFIIYYVRKLSWEQQVEQLHTISRLLLYPALFFLVIGIFVGAVWANVSWGRYWGWDPKEVWALITMLIYSLAIHAGSLPRFRKPMFFHLFSIVAFLSVLITYFGVNFFLGGIHSYA